MSYEKILIAGNLGRDPDLKFTPGGQAVCSMSVATNRQYTNSQGEQVKETTWWRVSAWGKTGENCNAYLRSGSKVLIEGRLNPDKETGGPRIWTTDEGTPRTSYEITADRVVFLDSRSDRVIEPEANF